MKVRDRVAWFSAALIPWALVLLVTWAGRVNVAEQHRELNTFETVSGKVVKVDELQRPDPPTSQGPGGISTTSIPTYEYQINGRTYRSSRIVLPVLGWEDAGFRYYPLGSTVTIHYDPKNPSITYLETRAGGWPVYWCLPFPALLLLLTFIAPFDAMKKGRPRGEVLAHLFVAAGALTWWVISSLSFLRENWVPGFDGTVLVTSILVIPEVVLWIYLIVNLAMRALSRPKVDQKC